MNLEQTERLLEQLHGQLDNAIEKGDRDTARYLYGQIAGALMLALYLRIIDEQENDRRYKALQDKFYDAFYGAVMAWARAWCGPEGGRALPFCITP